ncbi:vomeronasal type-2 receptor 26-like [Pleurodeles waltl]|uniref:vomeronasal type-2 receptor 26-like n=1 Tax=Pleurodeles waltl TaxID=8319 RepID=UPI0037096524
MGLCVFTAFIPSLFVGVWAMQAGCRLQGCTLPSYSLDGDILIGGVFVVHSGFTLHELSLQEEPKQISCEGFNIRCYRDVLAMVFAIKEINETPDLLPNITLGFQIFDSCTLESRAIGGILELLTGNMSLVPGYRCPSLPALLGIIGETMSSLTVPMARVMGPLHFPQISPLSQLPSLSDKLQFPSFLRTVRSFTFQNKGLARLIGHFQWTWVGMIVSNDELGVHGGQGIKEHIEDSGGCVAFMEQINHRFSKEKILGLAQMIQEHSVKVIIVHSPEVHVKVLLQTLYEENITSKVWIFTVAFIITPGLLPNHAWKILNGSLGIAPYTDHMLDFERFLNDLHPSRYPHDIFIKPFWEEVFHCNFPKVNGTEREEQEGPQSPLKPCSGEVTLGKLASRVFELNDLSYTYQSYTAVYALAHALHNLIFCTPGEGPFTRGSCADSKDIQPWQLSGFFNRRRVARCYTVAEAVVAAVIGFIVDVTIAVTLAVAKVAVSKILHYLKNVHFKTRTSDEIFFDENGDGPAAYEILNVQISQAEDFQLIKVGKLDPTAGGGKDITVNTGAILWSVGTSQVPRSVCSENCPPGYRKAAKEGKPTCCFDCVPCSLGEISNGTDTVKCLECPDNEWPNEAHDQCIEKEVEFLSYGEPLGLTLSFSSAFLMFLTTSVLCVFIRYRDTPIVKANNRDLSYFLLISLMLCFLCSFIFIGRPKKLTCMLRQTSFGIVFSISVSSVLAKSIIVVIAFKATNPNSSARKWLGSKTSFGIVFLSLLVQIVICVMWVVKSPPFPDLNKESYNAKIIFECNEGDTIFFYCMLGYLGILAVVSFVVAFLSRNLPGTFNEAKLITFSMLVFVSVWISFIPAYLSTRGKYMVAVEVFAILCSSAGLLGCIFFPKCYIILLRRDRNTKEHLVASVPPELKPVQVVLLLLQTYLKSMKLFSANPNKRHSSTDSQFNIRYYRDVLAMIFAVKEINETPELLPNITLGFWIFDSCTSESRAIGGVLELLSGNMDLIPGYRCPSLPALLGIIGGAMSFLTVPMARVMGPLHFPQISHASQLSSLSDKLQFPSFLRTVRGFTFQNKALASLIGHFQWTWVGMIVSNDELGLQGGQDIKKHIEDTGGCVAFMQQINLRFSKKKIFQLAEMIQEHSVNVIVVHSPEVHVKALLQTLYEQNITSKVWIFTVAFIITPGLLPNHAWKILNGSLGIAPYTHHMLAFERFLYDLHPSRFPHDIYIKPFWEEAFHCKFPKVNGTDREEQESPQSSLKPCSGEETLGKVANKVFELNDLSYTYQGYTAVYALAHALQNLIFCTPGEGPFTRDSCADSKDIQPWQILHYLKNVHFKTRTGDEIFFDENGDGPATYEILNVQISQDEDFQLVKVGKLDPTAGEGKDITVNTGAILWSVGASQAQPHVQICSTVY